MRVGLGVGFNSLHQTRLGFLVAMIGLAILMLMRRTIRLISLVIFIFPSIPFLGSRSAIYRLPLPN